MSWLIGLIFTMMAWFFVSFILGLDYCLDPPWYINMKYPALILGILVCALGLFGILAELS